MPASILVVDDDPRVLAVLRELFIDDYEVHAASSGAEALRLADERPGISVAVLDIKMPGMDGVTTGRAVREKIPDIAVIFHTGYPGDYREEEIERNEQPYDYIVKGRSSDELIRSVRNAAEMVTLKRGHADVDDKEPGAAYKMVGSSAPMRRVYDMIRKVAASDNKVMILGESGTGKELVARAIHDHSARRSKPFGIMNCDHRNQDIVAAELFGYTKGAFTGADSERLGLFDATEGGTVFLDEVGDLMAETQMNLLRVLDRKEFQPTGALYHVKSSNTRILCATNKDLMKLIEEKVFREDLYYRLRGTVIELPPLRDRREDIPALALRFIENFTIGVGKPYKALTPDAIGLLVEQDWPGNVRHLSEAIESLIVLADDDLIDADDVRDYFGTAVDRSALRPGSLAEQLKDAEVTIIIQALVKAGGNITLAAELLDFDRASLSKKIKKYGINRNSL